MQPRTNQPFQIGQFAANLFGASPVNEQKPIVNAPFVETRPLRRINVPRTRTEKVVFPELISDLRPTKAVIPVINTPAFKDTMDNYRMFAAFFNEKARVFNEKVKTDNKAIDTLIENDALTEVQKQFSAIFYKKNNKISSNLEFNKLATDFNTERGQVVKLRNVQTLKYAQELSFQQMIYEYAEQLEIHAAECHKLNATDLAQIPQIRINSHRITSKLRNGNRSLNICKTTLRRHRKQFEEAGVLVEYLFRGNKKAVCSSINPEILTVFDKKTNNLVGVVNQRFNTLTHTNCTDNNEVQERNKNSIKKENFGKPKNSLGTPTADFSFSFLQGRPEQEKKSNLGAAPETVKVSEKIQENTEILRKTILHPQDLAVQLASGAFANYTGIDHRFLFKETMYGTMLRDEYKDLIINEAFKYSAKIYRNSTPYAGSWKKAINLYIEKWFVVNNGSISLINKSLMFDKLVEFKWCINHAMRWYTKTGVTALFPADYFDFTRTSKREIGFEYTKKAYQKHLIYLENTEKRKLALAKKTEARKTRNNHAKKYEIALNSFHKGKLSLDALIEFVGSLPLQFSQQLAASLLKINDKKVA